MRRLARSILAWKLRLLTKLYIARHHPRIVCITGVTGKTAMKRAITDGLRSEGLDVRTYPKCYNTDIGLPLAVLFVEPSSFTARGWSVALMKAFGRVLHPTASAPAYLVVEFGISDAGDMKKLLSILVPDFAVVTDIQEYPEHQTSAEVILEEVRMLLERVPARGGAVLPEDAPTIQELRHAARATRVVTFGVSNSSTVRVSAIEEGEQGTSFVIAGKPMQLPQHGAHYALQHAATQALLTIIDPHATPSNE